VKSGKDEVYEERGGREGSSAIKDNEKHMCLGRAEIRKCWKRGKSVR
jgi:hypothetical protein